MQQDHHWLQLDLVALVLFVLDVGVLDAPPLCQLLAPAGTTASALLSHLRTAPD